MPDPKVPAKFTVPKIRLPNRPSATWELHKGTILMGGGLPLSILFRLAPSEMDLVFCLMTLQQRQRYDAQIQKARALRGVKPDDPSLSVEEADRIRAEVEHNLKRLLQVRRPHIRNCEEAIQEALAKGYF